MGDTVLFGPKRLSDFVSIWSPSPERSEISELHRLHAEGVRAILDTRAGAEVGESASSDPEKLREASADLNIAYAWLKLSWTEVDDAMLDRFGEVAKALPKPMVVVFPAGGPGGLLAFAHVAIEQGMPGEAMVENARTVGVLYGTKEIQARIADYVDRGEKRPNKLERLAAEARQGAPVAAEPHQRAVIMHTEVKAIAEPVQSVVREAKFQAAAGVFAIGVAGGLLLNRKLWLLSLLGLGYMANRIRPLVAQPVAAATAAVVPRREIEALQARLDSLKSAG